jgi:hypothetical protein
MATVNTTSTLNGLFKEVYADKISNLVPDNAKLTKMIEFSEAERVGNFYHQPVILSQEHGVTYAAAGAGAFSINTPIALSMQDAQIQGSQCLIASRMDYESASKASAGGSKSFVKGTELLLKTMMESLVKRLEISMLYGQSGLGKIASGTGSTTSRAYVVSQPTWAAGIWAGTENAQLDCYNASTKVNTNLPVTIVSVDPVNRILNVTGNATDLTAIDTAGAGVDLFFVGSYGQEMAGINAILTNQGTLFGINAGTYGLWKAGQVAVGGALTFAKVLSAESMAAGRGLNEDCTLFVSPGAYNNMNADQAALRKYDSKYSSSEGENGFEGLVFHAQAGSITVVSHALVKEGDAFLVPLKQVKRIGATDITFKSPGSGDQFFIELQSNAGFELRAYANQAIFIQMPARCVKLTGIVNS